MSQVTKLFVPTNTTMLRKMSSITLTGTIPWWEIVLYFLLSLVICFLVVLLYIYGFFRCFKKLKATFYPSVQLPTLFQVRSAHRPSEELFTLFTNVSFYIQFHWNLMLLSSLLFLLPSVFL